MISGVERLSSADILKALRPLDLHPAQPVLAHASLRAFGRVDGGAEALLDALLGAAPRLMMPTFTYKTMIIPPHGPEGNGLRYGSGRESNRLAEFFRAELPADRLMGAAAETLRRRPGAQRSLHPILSFSGLGVEDLLSQQTLQEPLAPIRALAEQGGWVLLLGVDHSVNTSLHYAEVLAGRKQFIRWALTLSGIYACPNFPGCSQGFQEIEKYTGQIARSVRVGWTKVLALPVQPLLRIAEALIRANPRALLCRNPQCELCACVPD